MVDDFAAATIESLRVSGNGPDPVACIQSARAGNTTQDAQTRRWASNSIARVCGNQTQPKIAQVYGSLRCALWRVWCSSPSTVTSAPLEWKRVDWAKDQRLAGPAPRRLVCRGPVHRPVTGAGCNPTIGPVQIDVSRSACRCFADRCTLRELPASVFGPFGLSATGSRLPLWSGVANAGFTVSGFRSCAMAYRVSPVRRQTLRIVLRAVTCACAADA